LFAGIIIASSGAVMDTSISIASSMYEMRELDPAMPPGALLRSGLNIGRDIMGTMANTLILAFTGSSINTILVIFMYQMPYLRIINCPAARPRGITEVGSLLRWEVLGVGSIPDL
jgi:uncharacterized membrane protein